MAPWQANQFIVVDEYAAYPSALQLRQFVADRFDRPASDGLPTKHNVAAECAPMWAATRPHAYPLWISCMWLIASIYRADTRPVRPPERRRYLLDGRRNAID